MNYWQNDSLKNKEGKLKFYMELKKNFTFEKYLDTLPRDKRKGITKLRISAHSLPIERMRYQKTDRSERLCPICQTGEVGDEWHYLHKCPNEEVMMVRKDCREGQTDSTTTSNF